MKYTQKVKLKDGSFSYRFSPPKDVMLSGIVKGKTFKDVKNEVVAQATKANTRKQVEPTGLFYNTLKTVSNDELTEIEISAKALEIYLQDKSDYDKHCPSKKWKQPSLDVYKEKLKSQLPEGCKK